MVIAYIADNLERRRNALSVRFGRGGIIYLFLFREDYFASLRSERAMCGAHDYIYFSQMVSGLSRCVPGMIS